MTAHIYNWLADFFNNHSHCTVFRGELSKPLDITASIIQGSAIGPAAHCTLLVFWRPRRRHAGKHTLQICQQHVRHHPCQQRGIAARGTRQRAEMGQAEWPETHCSKSNEIVFKDSKRRHTAAEPAPLPGIACSSCTKTLGMSIGNNLSQSTRPAVGDIERAGAVRDACAVDPRSERRSSAARVPCYRHYPSDVHRQRVAWSHQGIRSMADQLRDGPRPILSTGPGNIRWTMWRQQWTIQQNCQTITSCHRITEL